MHFIENLKISLKFAVRTNRENKDQTHNQQNNRNSKFVERTSQVINK